MFAGKTTRLIGLYNESELDINEKLSVKPMLDNRYQDGKINSHGGLSMLGHRLTKAEEIFPLLTPQTKEVYIDEIQFFGPYIIEIVGEMMMNQIKVIAAGLDKDYLHRDFGPMAHLKKLSTNPIALTATCAVCNKSATHTYRVSETSDLILIGHSNNYEARCETHWEEGMKHRLVQEQQ